MAAHKKKPGPKRAQGRPATAVRRERQRKNIKTEREILTKMGFKTMSVVVPAHASVGYLAATKSHRAYALWQYEKNFGDPFLAEKLRLKFEAAEMDKVQAIKQMQANQRAADQEAKELVNQSLARQSHMIAGVRV